MSKCASSLGEVAGFVAVLFDQEWCIPMQNKNTLVYTAVLVIHY